MNTLNSVSKNSGAKQGPLALLYNERYRVIVSNLCQSQGRHSRRSGRLRASSSS
jgi:hypothetical protein